MLILVSGEGPTDMGRCEVDDMSGNLELRPGPMAALVDQIAEGTVGYAFLPYSMRLITKRALADLGKQLRQTKLAGRKSPKETAYFFRNARALAQFAQQLATKHEDEVVAILFRDADRTHSTNRGEWADKVQSMLNGFAYEGFERGVPMVPNPKSEAWLLCALKRSQPYEHCDRIEQESGNDDSANPLKAQLEAELGQHPGADILTSLVQNGQVDASRIDMPSFVQFRGCLVEKLRGNGSRGCGLRGNRPR